MVLPSDSGGHPIQLNALEQYTQAGLEQQLSHVSNAFVDILTDTLPHWEEIEEERLRIRERQLRRQEQEAAGKAGRPRPVS